MKTFKQFINEQDIKPVDENRIKQIVSDIQDAFIKSSKEYPKDDPLNLTEADVAAKFKPTAYPEQYNVVFPKMSTRDASFMYNRYYIGGVSFGQPAKMNKDLVNAGSAGRQGTTLQDKKSTMFIVPDRAGGKFSLFFEMPN